MEAFDIPPLSQRKLIGLSRQTLENFVRRLCRPVPQVDDPSLLTSKYGAFVSLHRVEELRGCIGTCFPSQSLYQTTIEMTEAAASRDYRVTPISEDELQDIHIEISVLSPLLPVDNALALEVGKHGVYVASEGKIGVFLPQVATQHSWDIRTFLSQVCIKAGMDKGAWKFPETQISYFTSLVIGESP